ncbi:MULTISPECIES: hypothetical protein [Bacteroidota]|uniref:hypothetical protein n=1 Tax=Bacteroidota TaxID=976 RepID=UPI00241F1757|nr:MULTISPECIES: hypothetical protein [Bacteroidota]
MNSIQNNSKSLIIDVRSNSGRSRDLTYELAKYSGEVFYSPRIHACGECNKTERFYSLVKRTCRKSEQQKFIFLLGVEYKGTTKLKEFLKAFKQMYQLDDKKI